MKDKDISIKSGLTVGELITLLSKANPSATVFIGYDYDNRQTCTEAVSIEIDEKNNEVVIADKWY